MAKKNQKQNDPRLNRVGVSKAYWSNRVKW
jgi:hypothetical protein